MSHAYCVVTYLGGDRFVETVKTVPPGARLLVIDNSVTGWCLSKSWNYAIQRLCLDEQYDVVIVCNDDIVLSPDTGTQLEYGLLRGQFEQFHEHSDRELIVVTGYNTRDHEDVGPRWGTGPDFSCFATTHKLLTTMGPFDENFTPCYFEDNDAHWRLRCAGFEAMSYAPYYHYGSQTVQKSTERREFIASQFDKNRDYYANKWGGTPGDEKYVRAWNR